MELVFSHVWAIWWWRLTQINATADSLRANRCVLGTAPTNAKDLKDADAYNARLAHVKRGIPRDLPLELVCSASKPHARLPHIQIRRWNGYVPMGAICSAGNHLVCSPEFCFVLIACDIRRICGEDLKRWQHVAVLAELGCELCGTYSKLNTKRGFKNRDVQLVGTWQMRDFAAAISHERGASLAYEALRWVIDGLNSPMETATYLMLCLPREWGGRALPRPCSNWLLPVPEELWTKTTLRHIKPDLYWPERNVAVEFFGEDFHSGREKEDMQRQELEQDMGLKVVGFWKEDVMDLKRFEAKAASVIRYLGWQLPTTGTGFRKLQAKLHETLLEHQRWI